MDHRSRAGIAVDMGMSLLLGFLTSTGFMAVSFAGMTLFGLYFVPYDIFDWIARILPGPIVTAGIDGLVFLIRTLNLGEISQTAKPAENLLAVLIFMLLGGVFGWAIGFISQRKHWEAPDVGLVVGGFLALIVILIEAGLGFLESITTILWLGIIFSSWGWVLGWLIKRAGWVEAQETQLSRRQFVGLLSGGIIAMYVTAYGLSKWVSSSQGKASVVPPDFMDLKDTSGPAASPPISVLENRLAPAPGTRAEITSNQDFYTIDINSLPRRIEENDWRLEIGGLVEHPLMLTLEEIRSRPSISQAITLQCISNPIGGDLTGTAKWRGVQLGRLLEEAGLSPDAEEIYLEAADGFYESVSMEDVKDPRTLLVYEMNGEPLPPEHGFPLRIYIPNRYGMKQPKWIVRITAIDSRGAGYWVDRGWSEEARPVTVSVIDTVSSTGDMTEGDLVAVGGIAYAGSREIAKVEVQVDDGSWAEAKLIDPPLSPLTWIQWRYDWPYVPGRHVFRVRAYDGGGELQPISNRPTRPDGATGVHSLTVRI